jgi:hypothetical protein
MMTLLIDQRLASYFDDVAGRQIEAVEVSRKEVLYADGTAPERSNCHANVDRWVLENPGCEAVRGWAISARMGNAIMLDAHSVVRAPDGALVDITLNADDQRAPIVLHKGPEAEFEAVRSCVNQIAWPPPRTGLAG